MINTINTASTGLESFSKGLSVISENVANLNTAGFKQQRISYFDLGDGSPDNNASKAGDGVETGTPYRQFNQGEIRKSDNDIDAAIDGSGFFVVKDQNNTIRLTRAGQFQLSNEGVLQLRETGERVQGLSGGTELTDIKTNDKRISPGKATSTITLSNNLNTNNPTFKIDTTDFYDKSGNKHSLTLVFTKIENAAGTWDVKVTENNAELITSQIRYNGNGDPEIGFSSVQVPYTPPGGTDTQTITLDFSDTKSLSGSGLNLAVSKQDGYGIGGLTKLAFDDAGHLKATYSNGQTADLAQLALANTFQLERLQAIGKNQFSITNLTDLKYEQAQTSGLGTIKGSSLEASNVELTAQFSELIITQRAYQASSQVITTTNEMLAVLFELKGRR